MRNQKPLSLKNDFVSFFSLDLIRQKASRRDYTLARLYEKTGKGYKKNIENFTFAETTFKIC